MSAEESFRSEFEEIWDSFETELSEFHESVAARAVVVDDLTLHEVFRRTRIVPKRYLQKILRSEADEEVNVGSATGLFFEQMAASLIEPTLRKEVSGISVSRNQNPHDTLSGAFEQPDLLVVGPKRERAVIFEFKAAPKRGDLSSVRKQKAKYSRLDFPTQFYLVGGHVSYAKDDLAAYVEEGWATFLNASNRNKTVLEDAPILDDLINKTASFLRG